VLGQLPDILDKDVLVGPNNADDAGVYRITEDIAIVFTADYFTPVVDDPYWFGAIAASNSLSDIWAMGGRPVAALNLASFPARQEVFPALKRVIEGGRDKMEEAGVSILGGHTVRDNEPKYGYAVIGTIHPDGILQNAGAREGDALVLTKKIGTGVVSTGYKKGKCGQEAVKEIIESMAALNNKASEVMLDVGVSTATDITGFGLVGHLLEVLQASRLSASLCSGRVPCFEEAARLAREGIAPGGTRDNFSAFEQRVVYEDGVPEHEKILINDAQTSGGLLIFVPSEKRDRLMKALSKEGILAAHIGDVTGKERIEGERRLFVER
jgi:selenide,water dikinase